MIKKERIALVTAKGLKKSFKDQVVVSNLSVELFQGERISLSGPNGAGKTTFIRCILGQYVYDGVLEVMGGDPRTQHEDIMKHIGFVPQIPPPLKMTVKEMLVFFSKLTGTSQDVFVKIIMDLGLQINQHLHKPFLKLSGGMKQKLLIGFALGRNPKILLMDEPAANLDPEARKVFFKYLEGFNKDSLMILCSHRMSEISSLVNREIEMDLGEIVVDRKAEQVNA
ncbi:MAG: ABC transporter ATP-binding protein [Bacteroidetes bacterium 4572_77]|nr:MAG: ABC transporter ATP-binding protein [Bacteroidetes bacterium 4572_77]